MVEKIPDILKASELFLMNYLKEQNV